MSDTVFLQKPFAVNGDKRDIPFDMQKSGAISFDTGYGFDYERDLDNDPLAKDVDSQEFNQLMHIVTSILRQYQTQGVYPFITPEQNGGVPFPYAQAARCLYDDGTGVAIYESLKDVNTTLPTDAASWRRVYDAWLDKSKLDVLEVIKKAGIKAHLDEADQLYKAIIALIVKHAPAPDIATTKNTGIVQIGTGLGIDSEGILTTRYGIDAGTACQGNDERLAADYEFSQSFAETGWQKFPNGLFIQWRVLTGVSGASALHTITYPLAFSKGVYAIQGTISYPGPRNGNTAFVLANKTLTNFQCFGDHDTSSFLATALNIYWLAIGI